MPPVVPSSRALLARLLSSRTRGLDLRNGLGFSYRSPTNLGKSERFSQARFVSSIACIGNPCIGSRKAVDCGREVGPSLGSWHSKSQTRWFLGVGDGEEGDCLSKTYEERRVIGYVCLI